MPKAGDKNQVQTIRNAFRDEWAKWTIFWRGGKYHSDHDIGVDYERAEYDTEEAAHAARETAAWRAAMAAMVAVIAVGTPAARWRDDGKPDPHGKRYESERATLAAGDLTDDEVANAVFMEPTMANTTIAKDRIRWLSRALIRAHAWRFDIHNMPEGLVDYPQFYTVKETTAIMYAGDEGEAIALVRAAHDRQGARWLPIAWQAIPQPPVMP